ncbi:MAG: hypothetical protein IJP66_03960, partial [Kiritimatiellae bacterium]|nr:hypothetical protein [Kiritimatiellia bacterium]
MSLIEPLLALQEIDTRIAGLKKSIATLPRHKAAREADLSTALRRQLEMEGATEAAPSEDAKARLADEIAGIRDELAEVEKRLSEAQDELASLERRRVESAAAVPPEHLRFYERLAISHHPTIVRLEGNVCSGC